MRRLITLIVMIFAFAAVAGPSVAHAHRYVSTPIVVLNLVDQNNQSIPVVVEVQRGDIDLGSGISMPCGAHHGIPVSVDQLAVCPPAAGVIMSVDDAAPVWSSIRVLRPPKHA
ncbi:MAG: hypothetical protein P0Y65_17385 [Candidatus Devosia phytovorans]|uniref:Uncharacterized protein n=1 Tax=Candidatus Devosia phytovorans TaxID=3121372 RepID=A0AAJ5VTA2_9HYPH|nr:hypothetical protein [Devosia sp.]WEK03942.1 MAG: hypothetical protein P0Y65_17385 [Devosia sp.]